MFRILLTVLFASLSVAALAQTAGDFRSNVTTGNWNDNFSWQTFNGTSWVSAVVPPTVFDGVITVRAGHTISCSSDEIVDQVVVQCTLTVNATAHIDFPASPAGHVIDVAGTFDILGTVNQAATSVIAVTGGTLIAREGSNFNGWTASTLLFQAGSTYQ